MAATAENFQTDKIVKEFQELCVKYSKTTENIRTYCGTLGSGISTVPENIRNEIGYIVSFLQDKVNKDLFCAKDQFLMIYNFQTSINESPFYILEMLIKPKLKEETEVLSLKGENSIQLVIDEEGNIFNNNYFLDQLELLEDEQAEQDPPKCYGNYKKVEKALERAKSDYDHPSDDDHDTDHAGAAITFGFNLAVYNAGRQFEVPSPTSPFAFPMGESPPSDLRVASFLECRA